jgi:hypothetical protein
VGDRLDFFAPTEKILTDWLLSQRNPDIWEQIYTPQFQKHLQSKWAIAEKWLNGLRPETDITLLSYGNPEEKAQKKSRNKNKATISVLETLQLVEDRKHREIVGQLISRYRPDCWGGDLSQGQSEVVNSATKQVSVFYTETPAIGEVLEVYCSYEQEWIQGEVTEIYIPILSTIGRFSFIEIKTHTIAHGHKNLKAYSLSQIRKIQEKKNGTF